MIGRSLCFSALLALSISVYAQHDAETVHNDNSTIKEILTKPIRWIGRNWSAKDSLYCEDVTYNFVVQLQDNMSQEYLRLESPDGMKVDIQSRYSNKIGPYIGYRFLFAGATFNFLAHKEGKRHNEFTLKINSQLFNIDMIRRRTGGDFRINEFMVGMYGYSEDFAPMLKEHSIGDNIKYGITGININYFTNHRKFSNPAAYSNGALQKRSAGSPLLGVGYTHQLMEADFFEKKVIPTLNKEDLGSLSDNSQLSLMFGRMPERISINDLHVQLGYAYNLVLERRLLLSASLAVSPSYKWVETRLSPTWYYVMTTDAAMQGNNNLNEMHEIAWNIVKTAAMDYYPDAPLTKYMQEHTPSLAELGAETRKRHAFGFNAMGRASVTYTNKHWRAGAVASYNRYDYNRGGVRLNNSYWNASLYVGYCFGKSKPLRKDVQIVQEYLQQLK